MNYHIIPEQMKLKIQNYAAKGEAVGGFLTAVLENNLKEAVGRADGTNLVLLPEYVSYVYNEIPADCWGSKAKVEAHYRKFL